MALNFGGGLFGGGSTYVQGETGDYLQIDAAGNLNISGHMIIDNASMEITHTGDLDVNVTNASMEITHTGDLAVNVTNASIPITHTGDLDVNVTNATLDIAAVGGDVNVVQSGAWQINGDVNTVQSGAWLITGDVDVVQSGAWTSTIDNAYINVEASQSGSWAMEVTNAFIDISGAVAISAGEVNALITNSSIDMNISGATIENNTLLSDWKYIVDNGTPLGTAGSHEAGTVTCYTVPTNKKFYLNGFTCSFKKTAASVGSSEIWASGTNVVKLCRMTGETDNDHGEMNMSLAIPLVLTERQAIKSYSSAADHWTAYGYSGFEVPE